MERYTLVTMHIDGRLHSSQSSNCRELLAEIARDDKKYGLCSFISDSERICIDGVWQNKEIEKQ